MAAGLAWGELNPPAVFKRRRQNWKRKFGRAKAWEELQQFVLSGSKTLQGVTGNRLIPINFPTQAQKGGNAGPVGRRQEQVARVRSR